MFGVPLHRLIIYLPVLLSFAALVTDAWAAASGAGRAHAAGSRLSKWAAAAALAAVASGFSLAGQSGVGSRGEVTGHAALGSAAAIVLAAFAYARYAAENRGEGPATAYSGLWMAAEVLAVVLVTAAAVVGFGL